MTVVGSRPLKKSLGQLATRCGVSARRPHKPEERDSLITHNGGGVW